MNNLLLQYLSAGGQDLLSGQPFGANVNQVTQQNISAQNMMKLMQQILGGGGKISMDKDKMKIDAPSSAFSAPQGVQQGMGPGGFTGPTASSTGESNLVPDQRQKKGMNQLELMGMMSMLGGGGGGFPNPSNGLSGVAAADLAGLSPENITQALQIKMMRDELDEKKRANALANQVALSKLQQTDPLDQPFLSGYTVRQFNALPSDYKEYELAKMQSAQLGDEEFMSFREWKNMDRTDRLKFLEELVNHPDERVRGLAKELYGPTKISIGETIAKKKALSEIAGQLYFNDPEWIDDVAKHLKDKTQQIVLADDEDLQRKVSSATYIESKIVAGKGKILDVRRTDDERGIVWKVLWPSGDTEEIKYAFGS
jgi:hypothetical protein